MLTYEMGALLRKRYDEFLGPYYDAGFLVFRLYVCGYRFDQTDKHVYITMIPENSIVIASDTELSKMTALLISAGLWQPQEAQLWNDTMDWQPVPYTYPANDDDFVS